MFCSGTHTGRTFAYKSSSRRIATFALSNVPPFKVVVGAFNITLQALGNPEDIIALEGLEYASTLISGVANVCGNVIAAYKKQGGCQPSEVAAILKAAADDTQATLDLLKMGF
jgi:hypothetical protein